jgi:hypothetical protein
MFNSKGHLASIRTASFFIEEGIEESVAAHNLTLFVVIDNKTVGGHPSRARSKAQQQGHAMVATDVIEEEEEEEEDEEQSLHREATMLSKQRQIQQQQQQQQRVNVEVGCSFAAGGGGGVSDSREHGNGSLRLHDDGDNDDGNDSDIGEEYDEDEDANEEEEKLLWFSLEQDISVSEDIASRQYRTIVELETNSIREGSLRARSCFFPTMTTSKPDVTAENLAVSTKQRQLDSLKHDRKEHTSTSSSNKRVTFATNPVNDKLMQCKIHCYEQPATKDELWLSRQEINKIHNVVKDFATSYQNQNPKYIAAVLGLSFSFKRCISKKQRQKFRKLLEDCENARHNTRGLEPVIVEITKTFRAAHVDMVLTCQARQLIMQQKQGSEYSEFLVADQEEALRRSSRKTSQPSRQLARKLGEHDTFQAIKATLTPWDED